MGKLRVYWLKTLKKLSIYPLGNTPSAPSDYCGVMCCDRERRGGGFADMVVWQMSDPPGPIKLKATRVVESTTRLSSLFQPLQQSAMSLVNNRVFERSMGHQISHEDAHFHMHTSDGQHYPSNQQVRSCTDLG